MRRPDTPQEYHKNITNCIPDKNKANCIGFLLQWYLQRSRLQGRLGTHRTRAWTQKQHIGEGTKEGGARTHGRTDARTPPRRPTPLHNACRKKIRRSGQAPPHSDLNTIIKALRRNRAHKAAHKPCAQTLVHKASFAECFRNNAATISLYYCIPYFIQYYCTTVLP